VLNLIDTVKTLPAINGGSVEPALWYINALYVLAGLIATALYFWFVIRSGNADEDSIKEFISLRKNQNMLYKHLILYTAFVVIWYLEGIAFITLLFGNTISSLTAAFGWNLDFSGFNNYIASVFPKGKFNISIIIVGGGLTFFLRNVAPALINLFKSKFKKKSESS
jgi:hypothetical protein